MRTIAILNQKGGCGKTTTAINLSAVMARMGRRVLLIDMDPQSHCALGLGVPENRIELDVTDALLNAGSPKPIDASRLLWRPVRNLDLIPSRMRLAGLEAAKGGLAEAPDREQRLKKALDPMRRQYDVAVIDCSPSIGLLTYNALVAADMVVIPVETGYFSLQGATRQAATVRTLAKRLGVTPGIWMLATMHDAGNAVATDLLDELHRRFKGRVVPLVVRRDAKLREAASFGQSIADYAPGCEGAEDYRRLGAWIADKLDSEPESSPMDQIGADADAESGADLTASRWEPSPMPPVVRHEASVTDVAHSSSAATQRPSQTPAAMIELPAEITSSLEAAGLAVPSGDAHSELKPVSRAEDVARRAHEFLRKLAIGRNQAAASASSLTATLPAPTEQIESHASGVYLTQEPATKATSVSPSTKRLLGVRQTNQGVLFVQPIEGARSASIAGTFNDWSATTHPMRRNDDLGVFELCLRLPPGKYLYRVIIDGTWSSDPHNNNCEPNPFGDANSAVIVQSGPGSM